MNLDTRKALLAALLIFLVVLFRIIDHPFNATPVVAILIFSAYAFKELSWKIGVPFLAILLSDIAISGFNIFSQSWFWVTYGAFAVIFVVAYFALKNISVLKLVSVSLFSSIAFFLISNFAIFYPVSATPNPALGQYPHNLTGIVASYQAGLPFFKNMLVGDLCFTLVLFGSFYLISKASWFNKRSLV